MNLDFGSSSAVSKNVQLDPVPCFPETQNTHFHNFNNHQVGIDGCPDFPNSNGKRESSHAQPFHIRRARKKPMWSDDYTPVCSPVAPMDMDSMDSESSNPPGGTLNGETDCLSSNATNLKSSHFIFTDKKRAQNTLKLSSQDYEKLLHGKNLGFFHPRSMSFMRVRTLISKTIQTGTPHEEISGTAEVPTSSPTPESIVQEEIKLVQEEAVFQVDKKTRLTSASFCVSKVSLVQFDFTAVREHREHSHSSRGGCRSHRKATTGRPSTCTKKRSSFPVRVSVTHCKYTRSITTVTGTKRKEAQSFEFDAYYHRPFKKYRIVSTMTSTTSSVCIW